MKEKKNLVQSNYWDQHQCWSTVLGLSPLSLIYQSQAVCPLLKVVLFKTKKKQFTVWIYNLRWEGLIRHLKRHYRDG